ncbi:uncharacterized protein LOC133320746 [Danaus plexippus]|uniref:uncharacterized protein LOC133320746 n=1 Tax=Danaus plexippus TaxID=13037 RepID=UPI002AB2E7B3|nr:uncharacterized protein LOC133320746 [Danaus plexippus]
MINDSISDTYHKKFKYVLIPEEISDEVQELEFEGYEREFKEKLNLHFTQTKLLNKEKKKLTKTLQESVEKEANGKKDLDGNLLENAVEMSQMCQIIPITLPTKQNNFDATNAYIDNVGRVKNLGQNSQATRILQDDIRGDCFISRTYDDEVSFKRTDFTLEDFKAYLKNPPAKTPYDRQKMFDIIKDPSKIEPVPKEEKPQPPRCSGCLQIKENLKKCGACQKVA